MEHLSGGKVPNSVVANELSQSQTLGAVLPGMMIEAVVDQSHTTQLRLHSWDGRKAATKPIVSFRGCTYKAAPVAAGLPFAVRFPSSSKAFGTATQLTSSMLKFLGRYANLQPDAAAVIVAFGLSSWFTDCFSVAPLLVFAGPSQRGDRSAAPYGVFLPTPYFVERDRRRGPSNSTPTSQSHVAGQPAQSRTTGNSSAAGGE
jgi:hypothetical protein